MSLSEMGATLLFVPTPNEIIYGSGMEKSLNDQLQEFILTFENKVVLPLVTAGFDKYNIFDILNISRQELRHSDFLAFLLNPSQSGDIGQQFLRNFLATLSRDNPELKLDFLKIFYGNYEKVDISREVVVKGGRERIDILADIQLSDQKIIIIIENKVDTDDHDNQLSKYKEYTNQNKFKDYKKILLYLTPDKSRPTENGNGWVLIDYKLIYSLLDMINITAADTTIRTLINDYKKMIRSEFQMENDEKERLTAIEIYKQNRRVLDFIFECKPNWINETAKVIHSFLSSRGIQVKESQKACIEFRPNELPSSQTDVFIQINVGEMAMLLYKKENGKYKQIGSKQWLFGDNDNRESTEAVKRYQEKLVFDPAELKADCEQMLKQAFGPDGAISRCIATLKIL